LALSNTRLATALKLPTPLQMSVANLKAGGITGAEFAAWSKSAEGVEFRKIVEGMRSQQLAPLVKEAQTLAFDPKVQPVK
jgi:hypothetical protein